MVHRVRLIIIALFIFAWAGLLYSRLFNLQVVRSDEFRERAEQQQQRTVELTPKRGTIYDQHGKILAININLPSIYVDPQMVEDREAVVDSVNRILDIPRDELAETLDVNNRFAWLERKAEEEKWQQLKALDLAGVNAVTESKRLYPGNALASHVLGYVSIDNKGLAGVEYSYDKYLKGQAGLMMTLKGAKSGYRFSEGKILQEPTGGYDLHLTLDARLQLIVEEELAKQLELTQARSATVVAMDPDTGAIRALANMPDFDPNSRFTTDQRYARKNRAVVDAYEPGSTFKIITAVAAFENHVVSPEDRFDCQMGSIRIGNRTIRDHSPFGVLSFREIIEHSSNVGTIKVARLVGESNLWQAANRFGYGHGTGVDLPGENKGILRPVSQWSENSYGSISIGQEVSGNPLQIILNGAIIANGGYWVRPHVVSKVIDQQGNIVYQPDLEKRKIVDDSVVTIVRSLMKGVVTSGGGKAAQVTGLTVAGKTGTGEIAEAGKGYVQGKYLSSFLGFFPEENPRLVILCVILEPVGPHYGGQIGAPLFSRIVDRAASVLNIHRTNQPILYPDVDSKLAELTQAVSLGDRPTSRRTVPDLKGSLIMPELRGLLMQEAISRLARLGVVPRVKGKLVVVEQNPAAGQPVAGLVELTGSGMNVADN